MRFIAFTVPGFYAIGTAGISRATVIQFFRDWIAFVAGGPPSRRFEAITRKMAVLTAVHDHHRQGLGTVAVMQVLIGDAGGAGRYGAGNVLGPGHESQGHGGSAAVRMAGDKYPLVIYAPLFGYQAGNGPQLHRGAWR